MKTNEIIKLGVSLGLNFNAKTSFKDLLDKDYVVFDGINNQRFAIDGQNLSDIEIYEKMGYYLKQMGRRELQMELHNLLSIT